eukprot:Em0003g738a
MSQLEGEHLRREQLKRDQRQLTGDQFAQLMEEVRQLREGQEDAALKLEKGVRRDSYIFKRHGNENQYHFCDEIADHLSSASSSVAQRLIKFADRSEADYTL